MDPTHLYMDTAVRCQLHHQIFRCWCKEHANKCELTLALQRRTKDLKSFLEPMFREPSIYQFLSWNRRDPVQKELQTRAGIVFQHPMFPAMSFTTPNANCNIQRGFGNAARSL